MRVSPLRAKSIVVRIAGALGFLGFVGCRGVLDVDGYGLTEPEGPFDGTCGGVSYASQDCRDCIDSQCCPETQECAGDPGCFALSRCLAACDAEEVDCRAKCNLSIRRTTPASRLIACAASHCDSCAIARPTFGGTECSRCLEGQEPMSRFATSVPALEYEACQMDCPAGYEGKCTCDDHAGEGRAVVEELTESAACKTRCDEADWSCVGSVQSPSLVASSPLELHVSVARVLDEGTAIQGAVFAACHELDNTCFGASASPSPGGSGFAVLHLEPRTNAPHFGHLRVTWDEPSGENTAFLYFYPPLRRSPAWAWRRLVTRELGEAAADGLAAYGVERPAWGENGGIIWSAAACNGVPAEGVSASLESGERIFYLSGPFAIDPVLTKTSLIGIGAVFNAAPGGKRLELRREGQLVGTYPFNVVAGAITTLALSPTPEGGF